MDAQRPDLGFGFATQSYHFWRCSHSEDKPEKLLLLQSVWHQLRNKEDESQWWVWLLGLSYEPELWGFKLCGAKWKKMLPPSSRKRNVWVSPKSQMWWAAADTEVPQEHSVSIHIIHVFSTAIGGNTGSPCIISFQLSLPPHSSTLLHSFSPFFFFFLDWRQTF